MIQTLQLVFEMCCVRYTTYVSICISETKYKPLQFVMLILVFAAECIKHIPDILCAI